jgi:hypothetical protein
MAKEMIRIDSQVLDPWRKEWRTALKSSRSRRSSRAGLTSDRCKGGSCNGGRLVERQD